MQIAKIEERVSQKELELDATVVELSRREQGVADREIHARELQEELKGAKESALKELERVSGLTSADARHLLLERSEDLIRHELARTVHVSSRRKPATTPDAGHGRSSPTRYSASPPVTRPRRLSRSSSSPPTT